MKTFFEVKRKFSNRREWRDFIAAVQCSVTYPKVLGALRAHRQRIHQSFSAAHPWLDEETPVNRLSEV